MKREGHYARGDRHPCALPKRIREDRIRRYLAGEPLRLIAADHGVHESSILRTVHRYAPWGTVGARPVGGSRREWPE